MRCAAKLAPVHYCLRAFAENDLLVKQLAVLDLSFFHDAQGDSLSGRVVLNGVFAPTDLRTEDFFFDHGFDWRAAMFADLLLLI